MSVSVREPVSIPWSGNWLVPGLLIAGSVLATEAGLYLHHRQNKKHGITFCQHRDGTVERCRFGIPGWRQDFLADGGTILRD